MKIHCVMFIIAISIYSMNLTNTIKEPKECSTSNGLLESHVAMSWDICDIKTLNYACDWTSSCRKEHGTSCEIGCRQHGILLEGD